MKSALYISLFLTFLSLSATAQEETMSYTQGKRYIELKVDKLEKYNKQLGNRQKNLLQSLKKKEARFLSRVKYKDSTTYIRLANQSPSFDSLSKLERPDSATLVKKNKGGSKVIDSLKAVQAFIGKQSNSLGFSAPGTSENIKFNSLQNELNYRKYTDDLIEQRTKNLKTAASTSKISGFASLEKKAFYAKQKMKALKDISDEPTKAEEKALEYLQGTDGFDGAMSKVGDGANSMMGISSNSTSSELERMGIQTKKQLQSGLTQKFGANLDAAAQKLGGSIKELQSKGDEVNEKLRKGKDAKNSVADNLKNLRNIDKPSFKVNEIRGRLFWQRIEKHYNWQTVRATKDRPSVLELSAMAGFKQNSKLTYGLGVAGSIGLGQGWNKIKLSFEGIGLRSFASWEWQYGISVYAGYERMYKISSLKRDSVSLEANLSMSQHSNNNYSESCLVGVTKKYNLNDRYNGAIQILYDWWWKEKGLRSPIVLRFSTIVK